MYGQTGPGVDRSLETGFRTFRGGERFTDRWNSPVLSPQLSPRSVQRRGDHLGVSVGFLGDSSPDHFGTAHPADVRLGLYRDGALVKEVNDWRGVFDLVAEPAEYRLELSAERPDAEVSPQTDTVWTFRSQRPDGDAAQPQPLQALKFAPMVDQYGNARAGAPQPPATVYWCGTDCWMAWVDNPAAGKAVSVRAKAADSSGSTVEQTVIDAYRTK